MGGKEMLLITIPFSFFVALMIGITLRCTGNLDKVMASAGLISTSTTSLSTESGTDDSSSCTTCPDMITSLNCADTSIPVLGGVDIIQYWTDFKLSDGSYNESNIGQLGIPSYQVTHNNFQFNFISEQNKALFQSDPSAYIPQFGGFCAWGVGGEYCPEYPWAADCLGPSGNWGHWTIYSGKLYFFYKQEAKDKFTEDPETYAGSGKTRWETWFSDSSYGTEGYFSTKCFISTTAGG